MGKEASEGNQCREEVEGLHRGKHLVGSRYELLRAVRLEVECGVQLWAPESEYRDIDTVSMGGSAVQVDLFTLIHNETKLSSTGLWGSCMFYAANMYYRICSVYTRSQMLATVDMSFPTLKPNNIICSNSANPPHISSHRSQFPPPTLWDPTQLPNLPSSPE